MTPALSKKTEIEEPKLPATARELYEYISRKAIQELSQNNIIPRAQAGEPEALEMVARAFHHIGDAYVSKEIEKNTQRHHYESKRHFFDEELLKATKMICKSLDYTGKNDASLLTYFTDIYRTRVFNNAIRSMGRNSKDATVCDVRWRSIENDPSKSRVVSIEDSVIRKQERARIVGDYVSAFQDLTPIQQQAVLIHLEVEHRNAESRLESKLEGVPYVETTIDQVCRERGLTVKTGSVKTAYHKTKDKIRQQLGHFTGKQVNAILDGTNDISLC